MDDPNDGPWAVRMDTCQDCGKALAIVSTVAGFEEGNIEVYWDGAPRCSACHQAIQDRLAKMFNDGPPPITEDHL